MALITINGFGVIRGVLSFPRVGAWHADLEVDESKAMSGKVTVDIGGGALTLQATISKGGLYNGINSMRIVGGADGMRATVKPKHYVRPQFRLVLSDLLKTAAEVDAGGNAAISSTASTTILNKALSAWTNLALPVGLQLAALIDKATPSGTAWRMLPDGTLFVGPETWHESGIDFRELSRSERDRQVDIGLDLPILLPGTTIGDAAEKVDYVEHHIEDGSTLARVWLAAA